MDKVDHQVANQIALVGDWIQLDANNRLPKLATDRFYLRRSVRALRARGSKTDSRHVSQIEEFNR